MALCGADLQRSSFSGLAVLGNLSISGTINKIESHANVLQVCLDSGAKKVQLPIASAADIGTVPPDLMGKFGMQFYKSHEDAALKAQRLEKSFFAHLKRF